MHEIVTLGFEPLNPNHPVDKVIRVKVWSTEPLWFYCQQTSHCSKGIVFTINLQKEGHTFEAFKEKVLAMASIKLTGEVIDVTAGKNGGLAYTLPHVDAKPGDEIHFAFISKNHTITQSSFDKLCFTSNMDLTPGLSSLEQARNSLPNHFSFPILRIPSGFIANRKFPSCIMPRAWFLLSTCLRKAILLKNPRRRPCLELMEQLGHLIGRGYCEI